MATPLISATENYDECPHKILLSKRKTEFTPLKWHPARRPLVICPKNKPFFAETLNAGNIGGTNLYWS
jgi:hypothetical protein